MVNTKGLKEVTQMSNRKKALSNQNLSDVKTTHDKAAKKLNIALKIAGLALKFISIIEKIIGWLG